MLSITTKLPQNEIQLIGYKLHKLASLLDRQADSLLTQEFDLTLTQFVLLFGLAHYPQASQTAVAKYLNLTGAAVSRQMDGLSDKGLIERYPNPENRREQVLKVSSKGQSTLSKAKASVGGLYLKSFAGVSKSQMRNFSRVLDKLLTTIADDHHE